MKPATNRKLTRFYVINPVVDRRKEPRFESRETVLVKFSMAPTAIAAIAHDIGKTGMRLQLEESIQMGTAIEVQFPASTDAVRCYGYVVWSRPMESGRTFECGINVENWQGVVSGPDSWKRFKGIRPKAERRHRTR